MLLLLLLLHWDKCIGGWICLKKWTRTLVVVLIKMTGLESFDMENCRIMLIKMVHYIIVVSCWKHTGSEWRAFGGRRTCHLVLMCASDDEKRRRSAAALRSTEIYKQQACFTYTTVEELTIRMKKRYVIFHCNEYIYTYSSFYYFWCLSCSISYFSKRMKRKNTSVNSSGKCKYAS